MPCGPVPCDDVIKAAGTLTPCDCPGPGFCPRIGCELNAHGYSLCRSSPGYFEHWTQTGGAPCVNLNANPHAKGLATLGLGDVVAWAIRIATLGLLNYCAACDRRKAWLNRFILWTWRRR